MSNVKNPPRLVNRNALLKYIECDLWTWLRDLTIFTTKINFHDNFQSFRVDDLRIPSGKEVVIPNGLRNRYSGVIPTGRIIVRQKGNAVIVDGDSPWTTDLLYLKNPSENDAVISVIFFL